MKKRYVKIDRNNKYFPKFKERFEKEANHFDRSFNQGSYYGTSDGAYSDSGYCGSKDTNLLDGLEINMYNWYYNIYGGKRPPKKLTYRKSYTRSDGIIFEEDNIDGQSIESLEKKVKDLRQEANKIQGRKDS